MAELKEYVNVLADQIGPRPVSTEEEHQASLFIAQELTDNGLDVSVDEFATPSGVRWPYVVAFVVSALGTIISGIGVFVPGISLSMFILGLIFVVAGLFVYYTERDNKPFLSKMRANGVSQNVVAKYIPSSVARESRRRKVIIAAHVDTVRVRPEANPKIIGYAPLLHKIVLYCMIGLVAIMFVRLLPLPWPEVIDTVLWVISLIASVFVLLIAGCIIASRFTPYISGGNDNASSVAVLLSVARRLLNPEERERYAMERPIMKDIDIPVETFATDATGPIPVVEDEFEAPVMHGEEEAYAEGLVPEGVEITYDDDGFRDDATVAFPALSPEEQLGVLADTAAEEMHADAFPTEAFSLDDLEEEDAEDAPALGAIPDIKVPELDFTLDEEIDETPKEPVQRLDDSVIFAEYLGAGSEPEREQAAEPVAAAEQATEPVAVADQPEVEDHEEAAGEESPAPAPVYVPIEPPARSRQTGPQVTRPVPSWYAAAKEKAAKDLEKKADEGKGGEPAELSYRSRFADAPAASRKSRVQSREMRVEEAHDEPVASAPAEAPEPEHVEARNVAEPSQPAAGAEQPAAVEKEPIAFDLDIPDEQLDELSPDASGLFARVNVEADAVEKPEAARKELTSRIPNIGSSDDKEREDRKSAQESRAARGSRPELQGIPVVHDEQESVEVDFAEAQDFAEAKAEPAVPAAKPQRKKPTARHLTEQFAPTRAVHDRGNRPLGENRQEAPVSSTYEDTPQSAPAFDPFAPADEQGDFGRAARPARRRQRSEYAAPSRAKSADVPATSAGASSFPSLTGSFPALTGSFPAVGDSVPMVDAEDFSEARPNAVASDSALDDFMAAGQTTEINIPESRFRNAVDKVGGLFNRKGKNGRDEYADDGSENWEDDDYGWKGGGYFEEEAESAYDAVRQRAAQIRESVVSMTESDLLDKEVWFVALGASGAGHQGMKNFLDLHSSELRGSLIINLESVGAGTLSYVDLEGTGKPHRADRRLMSLVKKASKELKGTEMKAKSLEWRNTDATPAMIAGMRALTLMGFDDNGVAPVGWHQVDDTADIVEEDKLEYMSRLLLKVIENS